MPTRTITIDPITRLEGHGKIEIFLDDRGEVERAYLQVPELRGFETFCIGRPAEDMPQITSRICGVCPTAHHMAATKALDDLYQVQPPPTALKIRDVVYNAFMLEDHALHVYILGGPDFIVGPDAPKELRNVVGVIQKVGVDVGKRVIAMRRRLRDLVSYFGGKVIHPVFGLPGGVSKGLAAADLPGVKQTAREAVDFARFTLQLFKDVVLKNDGYLKLITSEAYTHRTYYMGLVNNRNQPDFYAGKIRVVDPSGTEYASFPTQHYLAYIGERVEPWTYGKFCFLKPLGWTGFVDGPESGVYAVAPLARLNVADGMATPEAQKAYAAADVAGFFRGDVAKRRQVSKGSCLRSHGNPRWLEIMPWLQSACRGCGVTHAPPWWRMGERCAAGSGVLRTIRLSRAPSGTAPSPGPRCSARWP